VRRELAQSVSDPAFLASLGHDLRGPLGAIGTWIHVLGSEKADAATQRQALAAVQSGVVAESHLVEHVSDLASILAGTLRLTLEEVDLGSLLKDLGVEPRAPQVSSATVVADPRRVRQLLAILLPREGTGPVLVEHDEGPGMVSVRGNRHGGPGLVASTLARALADLQGGRLTITAGEGGTAFVLVLPMPKQVDEHSLTSPTA
jgi:signal transduction histidine kinase